MKKKRTIVLFLQLILVGVSIFLMLNYTNKKVRPVQAYVYNVNLESDEKIGKGDLKLVEVPADAVSDNFIFKESDAIGKITNSKVSKGQYAYKSQLEDEDKRNPFKDADLKKLRKISLPISYQEAFAGEINKGDTVDLLYVGRGEREDEESAGNSFSYSKVFMSDVLVYSVANEDGSEYVPRATLTNAEKQEREDMEKVEEKNEDLGIITLAVTLEEAEQIQARLDTGSIKFVGRFNESESYDTLGYVMGDYGKVFSGKAFAETDELKIIEDEFKEIQIENKQD